MDQRRITMSDIVMGEPLPWDVYDHTSRLLLRRGHVVTREHQIEELLERGMFIDAKHATAIRKAEAAPRQQEQPSVVRLVNLANKRLERLLFGLHTETDIEQKIFDVAKIVGYAVDVNPDIALGCILLNQSGCNYSVRHCVDTAIVSLIVARAMGKAPTEIAPIVAAALTMNVGMLRHQEQFQQKADALTRNDVDTIHAHPAQSVAMLREAGVADEEWLDCVLHHHENEDGSGYPYGRISVVIPENAKIIAIADRYCARVSARSYRKPMLPNAALRDILLSEKDKVDSQLTACFIKELGVYPNGTYVRLENGEIGIVTGKGKTTTAPIMHSLIGPRGAPLSFPIRRDTSKELHSIRDVLHPDQAAVRVSMQQLWGLEAAA
jgi:HD-GYP domain-containing protein (c-di-GMP phosphodiesterase class II)